MSGDFPVQLATRLPDWSACGLLRCSAARLSVCRVVLQSPRARHARLVAEMLASMSRGCYEETASVECKVELARRRVTCCYDTFKYYNVCITYNFYSPDI